MKNKISYSIKKYIKYIKDNSSILDIKEKLFFTFFFLVIIRIGSFIPIYGIKLYSILEKVISINKNNTILNTLNIFSGGSLSRLSIFSVGIIPYISSSMLVHVLTNINPYFKKLKKTYNEGGEFIINKYIYVFTILFSIFQSFIIIISLQKIFLIENLANFNYIEKFFSVLSLVFGTMFLTWISSKITNYGIGNGTSIIIFIGIISNIPENIKNIYNNLCNKNNIIHLLLFIIIAYLLIYISIFIECSQKKIPINYPKQYTFMKSFINSSSITYFPIKVNISGIMPIIFSSSLMFLLNLISNFILNIKKNFFTIYLFNIFQPNNILYKILNLFIIFIFYKLYTNVNFNVKDISNNLKKSNTYIPNIRPGINTEKYIKNISDKISFIGSIYICLMYIIPELIKNIFYNNLFNINGISILILTSVIIEIIMQIQTILVSSNYRNILKKIIK